MGKISTFGFTLQINLVESLSAERLADRGRGGFWPREDLRFQGTKKEKDDRKAADVDDGGGQAKGCRDSGDHCGSQLEEAL